MTPTKKILVPLILLALTACNLPASIPALPPARRTATPTPSLDASTATMTATSMPPTVDDFFARCPTSAEIASVNARLVLSFEADPTAGTLVCTAASGSADLTLLQKRAYRSVIVMTYLQFDRPLPWTREQLFDWFTNTISGIRFRSDISYSYCCEPDNVIDIQVADNSYLMLTDRWIAPEMGGGLQGTTILYVHEARHNEGYPHTCPGGTDDRTLAEMGAWGVQYSLDYWLAVHGDRHYLRAAGSDPNLYRSMALLDSTLIRRTRFCGEPTLTPGPDPTLSP